VNIISSALSEKQRTIIKNQRSPKLVETITQAAQMAIKECQRQFKHRRWNCSSTNPYNVFGQILQRGGSSFYICPQQMLVTTVNPRNVDSYKNKKFNHIFHFGLFLSINTKLQYIKKTTDIIFLIG
jgi:hypothetical protein